MDLPYWVLIINFDPKVPAYHRVTGGVYEYDKTTKSNHFQRFRVACSKVSDPFAVCYIPRKHAERFARPCGVCFPSNGAMP